MPLASLLKTHRGYQLVGLPGQRQWLGPDGGVVAADHAPPDTTGPPDTSAPHQTGPPHQPGLFDQPGAA